MKFTKTRHFKSEQFRTEPLTDCSWAKRGTASIVQPSALDAVPTL